MSDWRTTSQFTREYSSESRLSRLEEHTVLSTEIARSKFWKLKLYRQTSFYVARSSYQIYIVGGTVELKLELSYDLANEGRFASEKV